MWLTLVNLSYTLPCLRADRKRPKARGRFTKLTKWWMNALLQSLIIFAEIS